MRSEEDIGLLWFSTWGNEYCTAENGGNFNPVGVWSIMSELNTD